MNSGRNHSHQTNLSSDRVYRLINPVRAGFPSPAAEYIETALDPMDLLLPNPDSSFFGKVVGNSMEDVFVRNNDFIIVDKSIEPRSGNVVMCSLDGTFLTKILRVEGRKRTLVSGNPAYPPIAITSENEFQLWGVVSKSIHDLLLRGQGVRAR